MQVHITDVTKKGIESNLISTNAHDGSINCIEASPGSDMHIATGGEEGILSIWEIPNKFGENGSQNVNKGKKKKVELNLSILPKLASEQIHKGTIEAINWINNQ